MLFNLTNESQLLLMLGHGQIEFFMIYLAYFRRLFGDLLQKSLDRYNFESSVPRRISVKKEKYIQFANSSVCL